VVFIYIVLASCTKVRHPITILSGLRRGFGAWITLWLFRLDLNVYSFVGHHAHRHREKNAIMQSNFALDAQRNEGKSPHRRDLRRLPRPLPSDHDDDDGRALRRVTYRLGIGAGAGARRPLGL